MWRTVIVNQGEKIKTEQNWLVVVSDSGESKIPIEDIYTVVIDNQNAMISLSAINALTSSGAHICFCNEKHIPASVALSLNDHYRPLSVVRSQMSMTKEFRDELWKRIVEAKIRNQARCLRFCSVNPDKVASVERLADDVLPGDSRNREGTAASLYFRSLFGPGFRRSDDDVTNAALNYGYAILHSSVAKTLTAYGYYGALGIHHENSSNPFNLADDIMEPLRPVVDMVTDRMCDELFETLARDNRRKLVDIVNLPVKMNGKKIRVRYAIDRYIASLTTAIQHNDADKLNLPELIMIDEYFEDDDDVE